MYVQIPEHLREPILKEIKQLRFRSSLKYFPALVLTFSALAALVILLKFHWLAKLLRDTIPLQVSDATLFFITIGVIVLITTAVILIVLRQIYRDCECQDCFFCKKCDAVDKYDSGSCPICGTPLTEKVSLFYTSYEDEQKILEKWGLSACKEAQPASAEQVS